MSLQPQSIPDVPEETRRVALAAFPKGALCLRLRDAIGTIFADEQFADLYPRVGHPAAAPWRLTLVTILQFLEGLSDRQAAQAVCSRIDWKFLLGLDLTDPGFDWSVLSEFRTRLVEGRAEMRLLEALLLLCQQREWLKARGRQRTDSTHILTAARMLSRLEIVAETLRAALNELATVAPEWLHPYIPPDWFDRYGRRAEDYRFPRTKEERHVFGEQIAQDGALVLAWVERATAPEFLKELPALVTLRTVWQQQFLAKDGHLRWRTGSELAPAGERIASPYDGDARYGNKRSTTWVGYKVHLTETCEEDAPHLITDVTTTLATVPDVNVTAPIETALAQRGLPPQQHIVDSGYVSAEELARSRQQHAIELLGPIRPDGKWQSVAKTGYAQADFQIDWEHQQVICPQGKVSHEWKPSRTPARKPTIQVGFAPSDCFACTARSQCTKAKREPRQLTLRPHADHTAMQEARQRQSLPAFQEDYARRAGIEGTLSHAIRRTELRRARYLGLDKVHLQHVISAVALNLVRLDNWLAGIPLAHTRTSPFARLAVAA